MGSVAALSSLHSIQNLIFSKPSVALLKPIRSLPRITCSSSSSSSSSSLEFNISFAPPKPKPKSPPQLDLSDQEGQLFIPWIVRGEDGNLKLQSHPPARLIHALADAKTHNTKKQNKVKKVAAAAPTPAVKDRHLSKAARRFYNENFREPPQRLSKVLAASGVASRRNSEELIFQGKVTVNGSVCNTPQEILLKNLLTLHLLYQKIDGAVNKRHLIAISGGTIIQGVHCTPDSVELLPRKPDLLRPRLRIVVHEGRNHEVRELVKNAGLEVHSLKRVRIGGYRLPSDLGSCIILYKFSLGTSEEEMVGLDQVSSIL
ncbi:ribosomal large subunit pseudouridine synthase B, putative [Ricinus communis]|uniref:Ribosomal large subunit pseudouridine synthase B, putative n=1 Tax=Ricinus communis TaxID=3988 RepID=B9RRM2_RICCO|nr:ribosomal large subunit pseudouridine synthase B, putative [Ricinus communis]